MQLASFKEILRAVLRTIAELIGSLPP